MALGLVLGATLAAQEAPEPDRSPVPLYTPPFTTPEEARGSGHAPEVSVRVGIDPRGRVSDVEVLGIRPSSDLDEAFARSIRETLEQWRYAPAIERGSPAPATLEWTIRFAAIEESDAGQSMPMPFAMANVERDAESYRRRMLTLPIEERTELLRQYAGIARGHMKAGPVREAVSDRFVVYSDAPDEKLPGQVANNMEVTFNVLQELIGDTIPPQPEPYRVVVFVFASRAEYRGLQRDVRALEWAAGFYNPLGLIAFHLEMPNNDELLEIMLHEATHAYVDRYVTRRGVLLPRWLGEGLADYLGASRVKRGKLVPGKARRMDTHRGPWGFAMVKSGKQLSIEQVKRAIREDEWLRLDRLLRADREEFYGEERRVYYAAAWILVHYLRHGEPSWAEEKFPTLMLYAAEGHPVEEAFRAVYGEPARFEQGFREFARKF